MQQPVINKRETKKKVKSILQDYRKFKDMAETDFVASVTASYSFEPKSYTGVVNKPIEEHVARQAVAQELVLEINQAINKINDETCRGILIEKYCKDEALMNEELIDKFAISHPTFYRLLDQALLQFATFFNNGKFLTYETQDKVEDYMLSLLA